MLGANSLTLVIFSPANGPPTVSQSHAPSEMIHVVDDLRKTKADLIFLRGEKQFMTPSSSAGIGEHPDSLWTACAFTYVLIKYE